MNGRELRRSMEQFWVDVDRQGEALKDTFYAVERLQSAYNDLSPAARQEADVVFSEWILGTDQRRGYDARAMVLANNIVSAIPALRELQQRDANSDVPERRSAAEAAARIIEKLTAAAPQGASP
ncbi:MAG: hypothetical protein QM679_11195 [Patulibacter sp.]